MPARTRKRYPTDLTDAEWERASPRIFRPRAHAAPRAPGTGGARRCFLRGARGLRVEDVASRLPAVGDGPNDRAYGEPEDQHRWLALVPGARVAGQAPLANFHGRRERPRSHQLLAGSTERDDKRESEEPKRLGRWLREESDGHPLFLAQILGVLLERRVLAERAGVSCPGLLSCPYSPECVEE
jgi:hypothetical protein